MSDEPRFPDLVESLKKAAATLREAEVPFMLGGGLASSARGGPETEHDVDLFVRPGDADRALSVLEAAGFRPEKPPEGWLYKAWDGNVFVDLIFETADGEVKDDYFERAEEFEVYAVPMLVQCPEDLLVMKLLALDEMALDLKSPLEVARALREQVDWADVRTRTEESPYAKAFFTLVEELQIVEPSTASVK
ncbi:MAG TPA: nucleotidyltransferase [Gaiellaceae bacterium]